jgi:hypothetical protein
VDKWVSCNTAVDLAIAPVSSITMIEHDTLHTRLISVF